MTGTASLRFPLGFPDRPVRAMRLFVGMAGVQKGLPWPRRFHKKNGLKKKNPPMPKWEKFTQFFSRGGGKVKIKHVGSYTHCFFLFFELKWHSFRCSLFFGGGPAEDVVLSPYPLILYKMGHY